MEHISSPWMVGPVDGCTVSFIDARGEKQEVAVALGNYDDSEEAEIMEKNARLISAAPELLAAIKELVKGMEEHGAEKWFSHRMIRARAAIAKATGETL